jgi:transcriptional regulator with XRE-family HTH domain
VSAFGEEGRRKELGRALNRLRVASGLSQPQLAERTGLSQPKLSRIESGKQRIRVPEVVAWCDATSASDEARKEVLALAERTLVGPTSWDEAGGDAELQISTAEVEAKAGTISVYQPAIVPGLLQTAAYARRVFSAGPDGVPPNIAEKVVGRLERQRILYDDTKRLRFVIPEAVLRWPFDEIEEQVEQLERLREVAARPNVDLRVAPLAGTAVWRTGGFVLFDDLADMDPIVHLELLTRPLTIEEREQVDFYRQVFSGLAEASAKDDEALGLVQSAIEDMRASVG